MTKIYTLALAALLISSCATTQVGVKENWIDERDVIALASGSVSDWMVKAGRPTLVEINGDTSIYYYNYRPTMYATSIYDTTKVIKSWGTAKEVKPSGENSTELWGSRKNTMQIKVVKDIAVSAVITAGPDRKSLMRDLNGDLILDPSSGYNSNISEEMKIDKSSDQFKNAYSKLYGKEPVTALQPTVEGTNMSPWEYYRHKQQLEAAARQSAEQPAAEQPAQQPAAGPAAPPEPDTPIATDPPPPPPEWH
ncbi:MAG: hypothetical protein FWF67_03950 [Fibromonadales bacterium]|nr:hypothetical protein [Fibromonadales bacterium]